eukprot:CAMPEP_0197577428 /NCGR_PEP_ID=MMETSP1326-20131121/2065_1 /TAXON_ID=1155430 /ORGANISM="Genus nov. species nov., Strain RCC2288" /LENGTH=104 /DNA_ID=CAMNT_0043140497 /DNA_START=30 /DNA_END=341 /DNA_ORIENTATION=+
MSIYIGSLPPYAEEAKLVDVFQKYGRVEIRVCEGFAFADYREQREADDAMFDLEAMLKKDGLIAGYNCTLAWGKRSIIAKYVEELAAKKKKEAEKKERRMREDE